MFVRLRDICLSARLLSLTISIIVTQSLNFVWLVRSIQCRSVTMYSLLLVYAVFLLFSFSLFRLRHVLKCERLSLTGQLKVTLRSVAPRTVTSSVSSFYDKFLLYISLKIQLMISNHHLSMLLFFCGSILLSFSPTL